ncbi:hydrolase-4 domain-containing protein [Favolaschia claudopus]|uniref:Hydrolase-4 domain-containing protein n=1 Tax=Favolaschia claudopus TaxID=2862362 RepID=A0AAV9ZGY7_9AGAR
MAVMIIQTASYPWLLLLAVVLGVCCTYALSLITHSTGNHLPHAVNPGLASLPVESRARQIYPEDWVEGGAYVSLPMGRVRYWLVGPASGRRLTLIPGLTYPALVFAGLLPILIAANYQVLVFDLYGRGYSDAPHGVPYDAQLYVTQIALLLQHIGWEKTHVVGWSFGGAIGAAFISRFPELVERDVILIASAGAIDSVYLARLRSLPFVESIFLLMLKMLRSKPKSDLEEIVQLQHQHLPGFRRALHSTLRSRLVSDTKSSFDSASWKGRRVVLLRGSADDLARPDEMKALFSMNPAHKPAHVTIVNIYGAAHDIVHAHPEAVGAAIRTFWGDQVWVWRSKYEKI